MGEKLGHHNNEVNLKMSNYKDILSDLSEKRTFKVVLLGPLHILGIEEIVFQLPRFYKAVVVNEKNKIFKIEIDRVYKLLKDEPNCNVILREKAVQCLSHYFVRLINLRKSLLCLQEEKVFQKMKQDKFTMSISLEDDQLEKVKIKGSKILISSTLSSLEYTKRLN